jgi:hypothetical protein
VHTREGGVPLNLCDCAALMSSLAVEGRWLLAESLFFFVFCFIAELVVPPPVQVAELYSTPAGDVELVEFLYGARQRIMGALTPELAPVQPAQPPPFEPHQAGTGLQPLTAPGMDTPASSQELGRSEEVPRFPDAFAASQTSTSEPCVGRHHGQRLTSRSGTSGIHGKHLHAIHCEKAELQAAARPGLLVLGLENSQMSQADAVAAQFSNLQLGQQWAGHRQSGNVEQQAVPLQAPVQAAAQAHVQARLSAELQMWAQPGYSYGTDISGELMCCNEVLNAYASIGKIERAQHLLLCMMRCVSMHVPCQFSVENKLTLIVWRIACTSTFNLSTSSHFPSFVELLSW